MTLKNKNLTLDLRHTLNGIWDGIGLIQHPLKPGNLEIVFDGETVNLNQRG